MATPTQMMHMDDGGNRGGGVGLEQAAQSPSFAVASLGSTSYAEPIARHSAQEYATEDRRRERKDQGLVRFSREASVPDVGGLGYRTRSGHLLKNQAYYSQRSNVNKWEQPVHAGINTWKDYHGPKLRTDANTMERLDKYDEEQERWEAKKTFVNTSRVQSLDRLFSRKLERMNQETATSWAPHRHSHSQVHGYHETFDGSMDEKPEKQLKKVYTPTVLERDREAVRSIAGRIQKEETWKAVWSQMEQERRADLRADLRARQAYTDRLMAVSGQPVPPAREHQSLNSCTERSEELARHKKPMRPDDVTAITDFAGLVHAAANAPVLEALFPGAGTSMSEEFRAEATLMTEPGWPPPPKAATPRRRRRLQARQEAEVARQSLSKPGIPVPAERFQHNMGSRSSPELLAKHSKVQFERTSAPPPPDQKDTLLQEDWSPASTLQRHGGRASASDFSRTSPSVAPGGSKDDRAKESLPAPTRSFVYPVLVETSPRAPPRRSSTVSSMNDPTRRLSLSDFMDSLRREDSQSALLDKTAGATQLPGGPGQLGATCVGASRRRVGASGPLGVTGSSGGEWDSTRELCQELDDWEATASAHMVPPVTNFFGEPRASGVGASRTRSQRRAGSKGAGAGAA